MNAVLWPYKFPNMAEGWYRQMLWLVSALQGHGIAVKPHPDFICRGTEHLQKYNPAKDHSTDICIYNHADISHLAGARCLPAKREWFFKPTVPDEFHTTLDTLGFGPMSSITFQKPKYEFCFESDIKVFFETKVADWISTKKTKFGNYFVAKEEVVPFEDYYLILGQCTGDSVVTRCDYGDYLTKLGQIVTELARVDKERVIVVKLHPYMDGKDKPATETAYAEKAMARLSVISPKVQIYLGRSNVHAFIKKARCVILANSGAGFEAMMHHKPIISWGFPEYHWVTYDLRLLCDMCRAVKLDWFNPRAQDAFLYWYMEKYCFYNQDTANRRVKEMLNEA